jgi:hypothetical protein
MFLRPPPISPLGVVTLNNSASLPCTQPRALGVRGWRPLVQLEAAAPDGHLVRAPRACR